MKLFRKGGLILFAVLALLFGGLFFLLSDSFIEKQLEYVLSVNNDALVEFDDFELSLLSGTIKWSRLQVADSQNEMKNRFETGATSLEVKTWKLFLKKIIVDKIQLNDVQTGTKRSTSGALPKDWISENEVDGDSELLIEADKRTKEAKQRLTSEIKSQPVFQLATTSINADSLISVLNLTSPAKIDSLQNSINAKIESVNTSVEQLQIEKRIQENQAKINALDIGSVKDIKAAEAALKSVNELTKEVNELKTTVGKAKSEIESGSALLKNGFSDVDDWIGEDYKRAREAAKLPDFDSQKIGELLFGKEIMTSVNEYLGYAQTARGYLAYIPKSAEKEEEPKRLKGQDIRFQEHEANPDFWIKQIVVNTKSSQLNLNGEIKDIISNQKLVERPTVFSFEGTNASNEAMQFSGEFNYLGKETKEQFVFTMNQLSLRTLPLAGSGSLPSGFEKGNGKLTAGLTIINGAPNAEIMLKNTEVSFKFDGKAASKTEQTFRNIMSSIDAFYVKAHMRSIGNSSKMSIDSNIDNVVSKKIKGLAQAEVDKVKRQIQGKIDAQVQSKKKQLTDEIAKQEQKLTVKKQELEAKVAKQFEQVEAKKKELEKKKEDLLKKGKDLLKSKIKF